MARLGARRWRALLLLGLLGPGALLFLGVLGWMLAQVPPATWSDLRFTGFIVFSGGIAVIGFLPEGLWRNHAFVRYLGGRLWLTVHLSGLETGWDGMHPWSSLSALRLGRWLLTFSRVNPRYETWLLEYRVSGTRRKELVDLAVFGDPQEIAALVAETMGPRAQVVRPGDPARRYELRLTFSAALSWLWPRGPASTGG